MHMSAFSQCRAISCVQMTSVAGQGCHEAFGIKHVAERDMPSGLVVAAVGLMCGHIRGGPCALGESTACFGFHNPQQMRRAE